MKKSVCLFLLLIIFLSGCTAPRTTKPIQESVKRTDNVNITNIFIYPKNFKDYANDEKSVDLVFYLHGSMGQDIYEPYGYGGFNLIELQKDLRKDLIFVSFKFDNDLHWSSPGTTSELIEKITKLAKLFKTRKIYIFGISMGGSLALNALSNASDEVKTKIEKVVTIFPVIDYEYTTEHSKRDDLKEKLATHFKGDKDFAIKSSPIFYYKSIPKNTDVIIVKGVNDTHVCNEPIDKYAKYLNDEDKKVQIINWDIDHLIFPAAKQYEKLIRSVLI